LPIPAGSAAAGVDLETGAWEAMEQLLDLPHPPDAVFCYNDSAALVAMRCCLARD
jgi:DNA-binding LacI/PurR family transcriptional regulator